MACLADSDAEINKNSLRTFRFGLRNQDQPVTLIF